MITDGDPTNDNDRDTEITNLFTNSASLTLESNVEYEDGIDQTVDNQMHNLAKYMFSTDLYPAKATVNNVAKIFTIGIGNGMSAGGEALLKETAEQGGGSYVLSKDANDLEEALTYTIDKINEANGTFTSPSVATSNFDSTRSNDAVYYAMFFPEPGANWKGNLKRLKVDGDSILDKDDKPAIHDNGTIKDTAKTFWLPANKGADGNNVKKDGANLMLANLDVNTTRNLITDVSGSIGPFTYEQIRLEKSLETLATDMELHKSYAGNVIKDAEDVVESEVTNIIT